MDLEQELVKLWRYPEIRDGWRRDTLKIVLRDGGHCVYCQRDMLVPDRAVADYLLCVDHLLPKEPGKYPHLKEVEWNQVLACKKCNGLKGWYDPNEDGIYPRLGSFEAPSSEIKDEVIRRCRDWIHQKDAPFERDFTKRRELVLQVIAANALKLT